MFWEDFSSEVGPLERWWEQKFGSLLVPGSKAWVPGYLRRWACKLIGVKIGLLWFIVNVKICLNSSSQVINTMIACDDKANFK